LYVQINSTNFVDFIVSTIVTYKLHTYVFLKILYLYFVIYYGAIIFFKYIIINTQPFSLYKEKYLKQNIYNYY